MARRPGPSFTALLFRCGEGAVCEPSRLEDRQLKELVFLSVQKATLGTGGRGPQARSVLQGPAVSVWRRRRLWAFAAGRQTAQRASFLVGSESNVRHWGPWPAGPVRPSGPCCFGVAKAPFVSLRGWKIENSELVFLSVQEAGGAWSVLQGPAVSVWRRRRLWACGAGRQTAQRASFLVCRKQR